MARMFNVEVFNQYISGAVSPPAYYTSDEHAALLGSADIVVAQLIVGTVGSKDTDITVTWQANNTLEAGCWADPGGGTVTHVVSADPSDGTMVDYLTVRGAGGMAAFGRFKVTATKGGVSLRIIATGYSD